MDQPDLGDNDEKNQIITAWRRAGLEKMPENIDDFVELSIRAHKALRQLQQEMGFHVQPAIVYRFPASFLENIDHGIE